VSSDTFITVQLSRLRMKSLLAYTKLKKERKEKKEGIGKMYRTLH